MSARARRPTDEVATKVFDEEGRQRTMYGATSSTAGSVTPQVLPAPPAPTAPFESFELAATEVTPMPGRAQVEQATRTHIDQRSLIAGGGDPDGNAGGAGVLPRGIDPAPPEPEAPVAVVRGAQRSEPIRVISMKDRAGVQQPRHGEHRVPLHVQLRSIAEVAGIRDTPPGGLGNLAPPRDPHETRARHRRDDAMWVCIAIALAGAIMLAVWYVAGR